MAQVSGQSCGHPPKNCVRLGWSFMGLRPPADPVKLPEPMRRTPVCRPAIARWRPDAKLTISTPKVRVAHLTLQGPVHARALVPILRSMFWRASLFPGHPCAFGLARRRPRTVVDKVSDVDGTAEIVSERTRAAA